MEDKTFPEGKQFLKLVAQGEEICVGETLNSIDNLGKKLPACHGYLGDILSQLYREACCFYGCPGADHFEKNIAGRVVNHSLASYRLLWLLR